MITQGRTVSTDFKDNGIDKSYVEVFALICKNVKIEIQPRKFVYFIDSNYVMDTTKGYRYENLTPNYSIILENGLRGLKYKDSEITNQFCSDYNSVIDNIVLLVERIISELKQCDFNVSKQILWFENMLDKPADSFESGIQRMLLVNQLFWQTDHRLTGLGAWDSLLNNLYEKDLAEGKINREEALATVKELFLILHSDYEYKSNILMGDTGQIFVLGKSDLDGNYICNELTYLFIEAMREVQLPDPKCLLRVNKNTPRELIEVSLKSIATGLGAPLLSNDDVVIPQLIRFGIESADACEYTTSACWEPLIGGKSTSLNNMTALNYLKALDNLLKRERLENIKTFDDLVDKYLEYLRRNLNAVKRVLESHRFQYNVLLSVFTEGCYESKKDVSWGGSKYHHVGITSVAMGNLINSLMNIKELVFDKNEYDLYDIKQVIVSNYKDYEKLYSDLKMKESKYGTDDEYVVALINRITDCVSEEIAEYTSYLGGKMKVGLSGPAYIDAAKHFGASFDGRKVGEPFVVHISNEDTKGFTELINCASLIKYNDNRFNGNVLDFMVSPDFINQNWQQFVDFLMLSIMKGFFQLQMNVVSSEILKEAKENPDKFPNLIVRVWGFSSYFKDLPEEYKDVLIKRAECNEMK